MIGDRRHDERRNEGYSPTSDDNQSEIAVSCR